MGTVIEFTFSLVLAFEIVALGVAIWGAAEGSYTARGILYGYALAILTGVTINWIFIIHAVQ